MYAQLGSIIFKELVSPTTQSVTEETNLAELALIVGKPQVQRVGDKLTQLQLGMFFHAQFCNPQEQITNLRTSRESADIMPLIMGTGEYLGNFVIKKIATVTDLAADDGTIIAATVTVDLVEYYDPDMAQTEATAAIEAGFAMIQNDPPTFIPEVVPITPEAQAMVQVVDGYSASSSAGDVLSNIDGNSEVFRPKAEQVVQKMLTTGDSLNEALSIINSDPASEVYARTRDLAQSISILVLLSADVVVQAEEFIAEIDANNVAALPALAAALADRASEVRTRSSDVLSKASELTSLIAKL